MLSVMARKRRTRSGCEAVFVIAVVGGAFLFTTNGGPEWFGNLMADAMTPATD